MTPIRFSWLIFCLGLLASQFVNAQHRVIARRPTGSSGYVLPLAGHWNTGETPEGFTPKYQMRLIEEGRHILPWFQMPSLDANTKHPYWIEYYEPAIRKAARLRLPISFIGTQWEIWLSSNKEFLELPLAENPNVITPEGRLQQMVSPFGGIAVWRVVGKRWTQTAWIKRLQELYPDPPYVLFISNNEHPKLEWSQIETDVRYLSSHGNGRDDDFKRRVTGEGWVERYRALQDGLREGLAGAPWHDRVRFLAYNAVGPSHFARWEGWKEYSLYVPGRIDPWALAWGGGSAPYYVFNWSATTDFTVHSPQVEAMNWVFMHEEARRLNPEFIFELSTWDGHEPEAANDKWNYYRQLGQQFSPERYAGYVKFGLWLLRPPLVREFRAYRASVTDFDKYFTPVLSAVDRVHRHALLREFWLKGKLVPNRAAKHPYQIDVPPEYQSIDRWYLLNTSLDPPRPWRLNTALPVFSLALVQGQAPRRKWLVYAYAPLGAQPEVAVTIPDYGVVTVHASVEGAFFLADEGRGQVMELK
jgi:hypothetical protein